MLQKYYLLIAALLALAGAVESTAHSAGNYVVYTTFYPTQYFTQRIGGDLVKVVNPVPEDADPSLWQPDRKTLQAYQAADMIVLNGAGFEKWTVDATLPEDKLVDTSLPLKKYLIVTQNAVTHSHGDDAAHSHAGINPHTWVDPVDAMIQAGAIKDALVQRFPDHKEALQSRYKALLKDLNKLDQSLSAYQASYDNQALFASHPSYDYLANRYKWNIVNLDLDPEAMPTEAQLADIKSRQAKHPARYLLWESAPDAAIAKRLDTELGLRSVVFSPGETLGKQQRDAGVDYLKVMWENLKNIKVIFDGTNDKV